MSKARAERSHAPAIAFWECMKLYCPGKMGELSTVGDVPAHLFAQHARRAAQTAKDPQACNKALDGLDFRERVDRWAAILALIEHQATAFWASSYVDARSNQVEHVS